jgi:hypothetical protein
MSTLAQKNRGVIRGFLFIFKMTIQLARVIRSKTRSFVLKMDNHHAL